MWFVITELCFVWGSCLIMFICTFVFILFHWCAKRFPCQMTLGSLSINTTCDSNGAGTAYPSPTPEFLMGFALSIFMWCIVIRCLSFFVRPLYCFALLRFVAYGIFGRFFLELHWSRTLQFKLIQARTPREINWISNIACLMLHISENERPLYCHNEHS
jgi:hypothetical protein